MRTCLPQGLELKKAEGMKCHIQRGRELFGPKNS